MHIKRQPGVFLHSLGKLVLVLDALRLTERMDAVICLTNGRIFFFYF